MKLLLSIGLLVLFVGQAHAQTQSIEMYVFDQNSKQAIPNVSLYLEKEHLAFLSDLNGLVELKQVPDNSILISHHLSYKSEQLMTKALPDTLWLQQKPYVLPEMGVTALSATELLKKALSSIPNNYPQKPYFLEGNYQQIHKENGKYVRLINAMVSIEKKGYKKSIQLPQEEKFAVTALRKSYVYEQNGDQHGDHLADLFKQNPIQYVEKHILNEKNIKQYAWSFSQSNEDHYLLDFYNVNNWDNQKNMSGSIEIDKDNFAITYIKIVEFPNPSAKDESKSNWKFINGWYEASFTQSALGYEIDNCTQWYHHHIYSETNRSQLAFTIEEQFTWETISVHTEDSKLIYRTLSNLYSKQINYDPKDWLAKEINEQVRKDLEVKFPLEYQFNHP